MPYYVSPLGNDETNSGTDPGSPLRSLSRAMDLIAEGYVDGDGVPVHEIVHLEPGTYAREFGERFPIMIPPSVDVQGSGRDDCIIEYVALEEPFECGRSDTCIDLRGTLSEVTIRYIPLPDRFIPLVDIAVSDVAALVQRVRARLVLVHAAEVISEVELEDDAFEYGGALFVLEGLRPYTQLLPLIEDCHTTGLFWIEGGCVERSTMSLLWITSPADTIVRDNVFDSLNRCVVHRPVEAPRPGTGEPVPQIINNQFYSADVPGPDEGPPGSHVSGRQLFVFGESRWEGNTIYMNTIGIGCDSEFTDNIIGAAAVELGLHGGAGAYGVYDPLGPSGEMRRNCPVFQGNTFEQIYASGDLPWWFPLSADCDGALQSFLFITREARPEFVNNDFVMHETEPLTVACIRGDAVPDFGGGAAGSTGGNTFRTWLPEVPHIKVDIGANDLDLHAENNTWTHEPLIEVISGGVVTLDVEPYTAI